MLNFDTHRKIQFKIQHMQVDNQRFYKTNYPVTIFTTVEKKENDREIPFFNLSISQVTDVPDVMIFNSLEFLVQHIIQFRSDDLLIQDLSITFEQIMKILETNFTGINEIFIANEK